jgi:hypothetical protein
MQEIRCLRNSRSSFSRAVCVDEYASTSLCPESASSGSIQQLASAVCVEWFDPVIQSGGPVRQFSASVKQFTK